MTSLEFKQTILPLKNKLFRFAMSFLKMQADAEDVVQEVMIKCWESIKEPSKIENMEAFSMTLVRNKSLDKLKKKGRRYEEISETFSLSSSGANPYEETAEKDTVGSIKRMINELPEKQRTVIILRDVEGFSYDEIAKIIDMSLSLVKVNLHRGRKQVRTQMMELENHGI